MMMYVFLLIRACWCIHHVLSCLFDRPIVPPSAVLVKRVGKIAAGGLLTRRRTTNAQESQIGDDEIVRKMQLMVVWYPRRCELQPSCVRPKKLTSGSIKFHSFSKNSLRRNDWLMLHPQRPLPFPRRRPLPQGPWRAMNQHAMESQMLGCGSGSGNANVSASGCHARVHSNSSISISINIIVNASLWLLPVMLLCTPGICRRVVPMPLRR
jgi:hypothetical protein